MKLVQSVNQKQVDYTYDCILSQLDWIINAEIFADKFKILLLVDGPKNKQMYKWHKNLKKS